MRRAGMVCLLLGISVSAWAARQLKPVDLTMVWNLSLDANGVIASLTPADERNPGLYQRLDPAVRKWKFTPAKIKGKTAPAQTTLTVRITLEPVGGFYNVRLREAGTGARYATVLPKIPDDAATSHPGGAALLQVAYDSEGHVTKAMPVAGGEPKAGPDIARAAVLAVKQWTFVPETVAGHGVAGKALVPVCMAAAPATGNHCSWKSPDAKQSIEADRPFALGSVVHLQTEVAGQIL